jgi:small subunit ribosomal protein S7
VDGKKVFYDAIDIIEAKSKMQKTIIRHLERCFSNVMPRSTSSRRVGGATFQIPMQIRPDRKISMQVVNTLCKKKNLWLKG